MFFVWDTETEEFVHYSDCAYFADAARVGDDIIILCEVSGFTTPYHLEAYIIPFGVKDIMDSGQRVYCEKPVVYHSSAPMGVELQVAEDRLEVIDDAEVHLYSSNINEIRNQQPNPEFAHLYKPSASKSQEEKLAIRSMLT